MKKEELKKYYQILRPYFEMSALFIIIFTAGFLLNPEDPFLNNFRPSPYIPIVLLIAMKYGSPLGLISGIICAVIELLSLTMFDLAVLKENIYFTPQILFSPLVYIGIGHFVGEAVHSSIKRNEYSRKLAWESKSLVDQISGEKTSVERRYRQLESKIASEAKSNFSLLRSLEKFDALEPQLIGEYAAEISEKFSSAKKVEYWRRRNERWERLAPNESAENYPPAMILKALEHEIIATSREYPLAAKNNGGDLAICMKESISSDVHAVVCFDIPFVEWGLQLGDTLKVILREAVTAYKMWSLKFALGETAPIEKRLRVENYNVFRHQVRRQLLTLSRSKKTSSVIFITIDRELSRDARILGIVASALNSLLRISDGVSYLHEVKCFMVFLPETPLVGAKIVSGKVQDALQKLNIVKSGKTIDLLFDYVELHTAHDFEEALESFGKAG